MVKQDTESPVFLSNVDKFIFQDGGNTHDPSLKKTKPAMCFRANKYGDVVNNLPFPYIAWNYSLASM